MKIMFICTGNICRSAMAEGMLKQMLKERKKEEIEVCSCGIYAQEGDIATYNAVEAAKEYGANIKKHKATNIKNSKIEEMDIILCATEEHKKIVQYIYPKLKEKIYTIKEYADCDKNGQDMDIKDPWGYDEFVYRKCATQIKECLDKIIEKIIKK